MGCGVSSIVQPVIESEHKNSHVTPPRTLQTSKIPITARINHMLESILTQYPEFAISTPPQPPSSFLHFVTESTTSPEGIAISKESIVEVIDNRYSESVLIRPNASSQPVYVPSSVLAPCQHCVLVRPVGRLSPGEVLEVTDSSTPGWFVLKSWDSAIPAAVPSFVVSQGFTGSLSEALYGLNKGQIVEILLTDEFESLCVVGPKQVRTISNASLVFDRSIANGERKLKLEMYKALSQLKSVVKSGDEASPGRITRFISLVEKITRSVNEKTEKLPSWVTAGADAVYFSRGRPKEYTVKVQSVDKDERVVVVAFDKKQASRIIPFHEVGICLAPVQREKTRTAATTAATTAASSKSLFPEIQENLDSHKLLRTESHTEAEYAALEIALKENSKRAIESMRLNGTKMIEKKYFGDENIMKLMMHRLNMAIVVKTKAESFRNIRKLKLKRMAISRSQQIAEICREAELRIGKGGEDEALIRIDAKKRIDTLKARQERQEVSEREVPDVLQWVVTLVDKVKNAAMLEYPIDATTVRQWHSSVYESIKLAKIKISDELQTSADVVAGEDFEDAEIAAKADGRLKAFDLENPKSSELSRLQSRVSTVTEDLLDQLDLVIEEVSSTASDAFRAQTDLSELQRQLERDFAKSVNDRRVLLITEERNRRVLADVRRCLVLAETTLKTATKSFFALSVFSTKSSRLLACLNDLAARQPALNAVTPGFLDRDEIQKEVTAMVCRLVALVGPPEHVPSPQSPQVDLKDVQKLLSDFRDTHRATLNERLRKLKLSRLAGVKEAAAAIIPKAESLMLKATQAFAVSETVNETLNLYTETCEILRRKIRKLKLAKDSRNFAAYRAVLEETLQEVRANSAEVEKLKTSAEITVSKTPDKADACGREVDKLKMGIKELQMKEYSVNLRNLASAHEAPVKNIETMTLLERALGDLQVWLKLDN